MAIQPRGHVVTNPAFNDWQGLSTGTAVPPFDFDRVTLRYFPLRADLHTLEQFCDNYLNVCEDFAYFKPAMPFVLLCIVDYGKMSLAKGNVGWATQNELFFSVPVEWYEPEGDRLVFRDTGQVAPFIFVDNDASEAGGREVYGWPKVRGWFAQGINPWTRHPRNRRQLLKLRTNLVEKLFDGRRYQASDLLIIEEEPPPSITVWPTEFDNPLNPFSTIPRAMRTWGATFAAAMEIMAPPILGGPNKNGAADASSLMQSMTQQIDQFAKEFHGYTFNLKQLRDAAEPEYACYQALVAARMDIRQFRRGGLLGEPALFLGDASAGFTINLRRYPSQPIIETLGLEVESETNEHGVANAVLKPVLPFWHEMDMRYQKGENLCWRPISAPWGNDTHVSDLRDPWSNKAMYNTTGSSAFQVATGPFKFPGASLRVLPLAANNSALQRVCDLNLNADMADSLRDRYDAWGNHVYMVVTNFNTMSSATDNLGLWADRQVDFMIPVKCYHAGELVSLATVTPFRYTNSDIATTTQREVTGWPSVTAQIHSPPNHWLTTGNIPERGIPVLTLSTLVSAAVNVGQEAEVRALIEVFHRPEDRRDRAAQAQKSEDARNEFGELALNMLRQRQPVNNISLKQFRDGERPLEACYQAHVRTSMVANRIASLEAYSGSIDVKFNRFPTQNIVDTLGLEVDRRSAQSDSYHLTARGAFQVQLDLETQAAQVICSRAGSDIWMATLRNPDDYYFMGEKHRTAAGLVERFEPQDAIDFLLSGAYGDEDFSAR